MKPCLGTFIQILAGGNGLLESVAWKSLLVMALVTLLMAGWRRGAAAARHLTWLTSLLCILCLPFFSPLIPTWRAPAWMEPAELMNNLPGPLSYLTQNPAPQKSQSSTGAAVKPSSAQKPAPAGLGAEAVNHPVIVWENIVTGLWLAGLAAGAVWFLAVRIRLYRLSQELAACPDADWLKLFDQLCRDYQIRRRVRLLVADGPVPPVTWGFLNPAVVLPAEARSWSFERLAIVLRHELAHVRRWDCLAQELAQFACVVYWFNPLVWLAADRMRTERERACDDFLLNTGAKPLEYAGHLVEIARQFAGRAGLGGAVAMARPSGLEQRVTAILDQRRLRRQTSRITQAGVVVTVIALGLITWGCSWQGLADAGAREWSANKSLVSVQLKNFVAEKAAQEAALLKTDEVNWKNVSPRDNEPNYDKPPDVGPFFAAAANGDWEAVSHCFEQLKTREVWSPGHPAPTLPQGTWWEPVMETYGAMELLANGDEKYEVAFGTDIINSIPPGSLYFGGTDPGRFLITALSESHPEGKPFFTLTQNALADGKYLDYLRTMYGDQIQIPTGADSQKCFEDFTADITRRLNEHKLKPGEQIKMGQGRTQISGMTAVMEINGLLVKTLFDRNPDREFYIEQSYPLDWAYPNLEPHGLIFKINRQPVATLSPEMVQQDHDYWKKYLAPMIGDWLDDDTTVKDVTDFAEKVFLQHDFSGFTGDPAFVQNHYSSEAFSKLRSSQADLYVWRMMNARSDAETERMARAADFAFRQALALCPYDAWAMAGNMDPTVPAKAYVSFLKNRNRLADADLVTACVDRFKVFRRN